MIRHLPVYQSTTANATDTPIATLLPLEIVKTHLKVQHDDEDDYIRRLIRNAVDICSQFVGKSLIPGVRYFYSDKFEKEYRIYDAVHSIESITYKDAANQTQQVDLSHVTLTSYGEYQVLKINPVPTDVHDTHVDIKVMYNAGTHIADEYVLPGNVEQAILVMVGEFYEYREDRVWHINRTSERLLSVDKDYTF